MSTPAGPGHRPEIVVPKQEIDNEGRSHSLHETYTDIATRGLIRSVADDPMVALTITVARMFVILALQGGSFDRAIRIDAAGPPLQPRSAVG